MRFIARKTLRDFYDRLADSKPTRGAWFHEAIASC
jgi:hypothetical protein